MEEEKERKSWTLFFHPSLSSIVSDQLLLLSFRKFMESCLSIELIDFYLVVNDYQLISDPVERNVSFQEIVKLYFSETSEKAINVSASCFSQIQNSQNPPSPNIFSQAKKQVMSNLIRDSLPRYFESPFYSDYLVNRPDTPQEDFSRKKVIDFFGEQIIGPLCRCEIIYFQDKKTVLTFTERQSKADKMRPSGEFWASFWRIW